ncbi:MAG: dipeptidase [Chloroflexi bacterium]|nr:MAG: dipeptidase [Chloroflexota bacterium]
MTATPHAYIEEHAERILNELIEFVRLPSVSTDPTYHDGVEQAAHWVAAQFEMLGLSDVRLMATSGHPAVYAEWLNAPGKPTILVYGHYDVQPPDPLDKWLNAPFTPEIRDGRLYGRGVSDDKGPLFIAIKAAEAYLRTVGQLPVNIKFLIEGEEEIGSPGVAALVRDNPEQFAADFVLSADGAMWRIDEPSITISSRGMSGVNFTLFGPSKDLHSGRHGGAVMNPLHAMAQLIASLHDADGRVAVAGFYDDVVDVSADDRAAIQNLPFDDDAYMQQVGVDELFGEATYTTLERQWIRPTLELNGMGGGYQGPGSKSVIPAEAHAKITCRLVPNQDPADIRAKVIKHLETHLPPGTRIEFEPGFHGVAPYQVTPGHIGLIVAEQALKAVYEQPPLMVRMGGTLPLATYFKQYLGIDTIFFSFSTADEDFHAPNEFFRINRLYEGIAAWIHYWDLLASSE